MEKALYDEKRQFGVILAAVRSFGIDAELSGRNDMSVDQKKFSGNAFFFSRDNALHHGTLLIGTDRDAMFRYLKGSPIKLQAKGITSVSSRVINLGDLCRELTVPAMNEALIAAFEKEYGKSETLGDFPPRELDLYREKYASWQWRFGESPDFDLSLAHRFAWGSVELNFQLHAGCVSRATVYSDAMDPAFIGAIGPQLAGLPLRSSVLAGAIDRIPVEPVSEPLRAELSRWVLDRGI